MSKHLATLNTLTTLQELRIRKIYSHAGLSQDVREEYNRLRGYELMQDE
jgi:hypothetical protein